PQPPPHDCVTSDKPATPPPPPITPDPPEVEGKPNPPTTSPPTASPPLPPPPPKRPPRAPIFWGSEPLGKTTPHGPNERRHKGPGKRTMLTINDDGSIGTVDVYYTGMSSDVALAVQAFDEGTPTWGDIGTMAAFEANLASITLGGIGLADLAFAGLGEAAPD